MKTKLHFAFLLLFFPYFMNAQFSKPKTNYWFDFGFSGYGIFDSYLGLSFSYNKAFDNKLFLSTGYNYSLNFEKGSSIFQIYSVSFGKQYNNGILYIRPRIGINGIFSSSPKLLNSQSLLGLNLGGDAVIATGFLGLGIFANYYYNLYNDFFEFGAKYSIGRFVKKKESVIY